MKRDAYRCDWVAEDLEFFIKAILHYPMASMHTKKLPDLSPSDECCRRQNALDKTMKLLFTVKQRMMNDKEYAVVYWDEIEPVYDAVLAFIELEHKKHGKNFRKVSELCFRAMIRIMNTKCRHEDRNSFVYGNIKG